MSPIGELSPQGSIALGILVGLVSTSVQSIGLTLQRKSHILEDEKKPNELRRPPFKRRRWQLGMLMFIFSNLAGSCIQITTLPLPVLSTLQASGLVFNSICATLILHEAFTRWSFGGTILVCTGAVLIAVFGAIGEPAHNLNELLALMHRPQFIVLVCSTLALALAIVATAKLSKYVRPWAKNDPRMRLFRGLSYGGVSGVLSAHSLLLAKSAVELLVRTIEDRHNEFNRWQSWVILLGLLALALSQLYYLHRGLKLCSTSVLYPFVFCVYNIIAILDGLIYFNQTDQLTVLHACLIALGTVILLSGVLSLSWRLNYEPSARPVLASGSPLSPSLKIVDDNISETQSTTDSLRTEQTPLLSRATRDTYMDVGTPTPYGSGFLRAGNLQGKIKREQQEIWQELQDDNCSSVAVRATRPMSLEKSADPLAQHALSTDEISVSSEDSGRRSQTAQENVFSHGRSFTGRTYRPYRKRGSTLALEERDLRKKPIVRQSSKAWWKFKWRTRDQRDKGKERRDVEDDQP